MTNGWKKVWGIAALAIGLMTAAPLKSHAQDRGKDSGLVFKKGGVDDKDALKQRAEQIKGQEKAIREQRRQARIRKWQERSVGVPVHTPPIWGQTPLQQQQMAVRDQKRLLQLEQRRQQSVKPGQ